MTEQEPSVAVDVEETTSPVEAGETLSVSVAVENTGETETTTGLELQNFDGEQVDTTDEQTLDSGESETVDLEWETETGDAGSGEVTVTNGAESASEAVTLEDAPAFFDVEIPKADDNVTKGETIAVTITVENTGGLQGTQEVEITVNEEQVETRGVTLDGGETETMELEYETATEDVPDINVTASTDDDSASVTIPVVEQSVTPIRKTGSKEGMGAFGWAIAIGMAIVLIPLIPFVLVLKLVDMLFGSNEQAR